MPPKTSITQRLRTDLGRSVGVTSHPTGVVKPVYGYPTFPLTATVSFCIRIKIFCLLQLYLFMLKRKVEIDPLFPRKNTGKLD